MTEWFEDESFWEALYPFLFPADRFDAAAGELDRIFDLIDFEGREVLDLCCGPGRHTVDLARRGYAVTGVDRSPFLLTKARERALAIGTEAEWVEPRCFASARAMSLSDCPHLHRSQSSFFCAAENPRRPICAICNISWPVR